MAFWEIEVYHPHMFRSKTWCLIRRLVYLSLSLVVSCKPPGENGCESNQLGYRDVEWWWYHHKANSNPGAIIQGMDRPRRWTSTTGGHETCHGLASFVWIGTFCLHVKWASSDILHGLPVISFRWDKTFSKIVSLKWLPGIHTAYVQKYIIPIHVHWHISGIVWPFFQLRLSKAVLTNGMMMSDPVMN